MKRKEMLKNLNQEAKRLKENLRMTNKMKDKSFNRLQNYSERYNKLILVNIVLIQRWWRGCQ